VSDFQRIEVQSREEWRDWLAANHRQTESIWLVTHKKNAGAGYIPYAAIVEEALCFGWVDSVPKALDTERSMRLVSPRKRGSAWSRVNKERACALIASGRMAAAGIATVEAAKADGSWTRLDAVEALHIPDDLAAALNRHADALTNFEAFPRSSKRLILEWIAAAKRVETRARRIEETALLAARNQRAQHFRASRI
jgi:uncharacterized protein YdeI (YjbR/CyaY-like superfamily)